MRTSPSRKVWVLAGILLIAGLVAAYYWGVSHRPSPIGVVHETELRIAPEISGRLESFRVRAGQQIRKGDVLAVLHTPELEAAVQEAKAAAASARADRANVFAGTRREEVDIAAQNVRIAEANTTLAKQQSARAEALASKGFAAKQQSDEARTTLEKSGANLALLQAIHAQNVAGPTQEERAIAEAKVALADATVADLEAKLAKTVLVAPSDGTVGLLVAELGEAISPGQPVLTLVLSDALWFSFTIREDHLGTITIGAPLRLLTAKGERIDARVTELRSLGEFAVWRAARAVGDHDRNGFWVRADPIAKPAGLEPGMSVWMDRD